MRYAKQKILVDEKAFYNNLDIITNSLTEKELIDKVKIYSKNPMENLAYLEVFICGLQIVRSNKGRHMQKEMLATSKQIVEGLNMPAVDKTANKELNLDDIDDLL